MTPTGGAVLHGFHVAMRKLFLLPVVVAAIWFDRRGAFIAAGLATVVYLPHVVVQWSGQPGENLNQLGEIASLWLVAWIAGALVKREKSVRQELLATNRGALLALVSALDAREKETERHSLRVSAYAGRLGRELGLEGQELETLVIAALLHDVGKIGVKDEILLKAGPLSDEEWAIMQEHPSIGSQILCRIPGLQPVAEAVLSHHEHYDGSGYPEGLKGEEAARASRIFSVVDAFDAMTMKRPYRGETFDYGSACGILRQQSGKQFDPEVVTAFLEIPEEEWRQLAVVPRGLRDLQFFSPS
ncbi:MAG: HD domain-containing protein [Nitrospirae bacterium]|nr:HD domain-containing protein [Nitrospirota bacterium]